MFAYIQYTNCTSNISQAVATAKKEKRALTPVEQKLVDDLAKAANVIVQVDAFDKLGSEVHDSADYVRPALRGTKFATLTQQMAATAAVRRWATEREEVCLCLCVYWGAVCIGKKIVINKKAINEYFLWHMHLRGDNKKINYFPYVC